MRTDKYVRMYWNSKAGRERDKRDVYVCMYSDCGIKSAPAVQYSSQIQKILPRSVFWVFYFIYIYININNIKY
jgi:hypothetical protein